MRRVDYVFIIPCLLSVVMFPFMLVGDSGLRLILLCPPLAATLILLAIFVSAIFKNKEGEASASSWTPARYLWLIPVVLFVASSLVAIAWPLWSGNAIVTTARYDGVSFVAGVSGLIWLDAIREDNYGIGSGYVGSYIVATTMSFVFSVISTIWIAYLIQTLALPVPAPERFSVVAMMIFFILATLCGVQKIILVNTKRVDTSIYS